MTAAPARILATGCYSVSGSGDGQGVEILSWTPPQPGQPSGEAGSAEVLARAELADPSFVLWHPSGALLYAVTETSPTRVVALRLGAEARSLEAVGELELKGSGGCHLAFGPDADTLLVAEYGSGHVESVRLDAEGIPVEVVDVIDHHDFAEGREAHPHQIVLLPGTALIAVPDLGLDRVVVYRQGTGGHLDMEGEIAFRSGTGPRHLAADHESYELHIAAERSGEIVTALRRRAEEDSGAGQWAPSVQETPAWSAASAVAGSEQGEMPNPVSHIALSEDEHLVLLANRGPSTLAAFDRGGQTPQRVSEIEVGAHPRHLAILGYDILVAAQEAGRIDQIRWTGRELAVAGAPIPSASVSCIAPRPTARPVPAAAPGRN